VKRAIALEDSPTILVGHSYGGVVITKAGNDPKVASLVYIAAFALETLSTLADLPPTFGPLFDKCLQIDSRKRFQDAVEPADAFAELVRETEKLSLEKQLERYRRPRRTPALRVDGHTEPSGELLSCHRTVAVKSMAIMSWFRLTQDEKQKDFELALSLVIQSFSGRA
jgi:pimeloyl-ACP methyl ester carboxylesterase